MEDFLNIMVKADKVVSANPVLIDLQDLIACYIWSSSLCWQDGR